MISITACIKMRFFSNKTVNIRSLEACVKTTQDGYASHKAGHGITEIAQSWNKKQEVGW